MTELAPRPSHLAGQACVVLAGALVPLLLVGLAGGGGSLGWVALAGGAACGSGMLLGSTQRLLPALALAMIAAAALALAAAASQRDTVQEGAFVAGAAGPRADAGAGARATFQVGAGEATRDERARKAAPRTPARSLRRHNADL